MELVQNSTTFIANNNFDQKGNGQDQRNHNNFNNRRGSFPRGRGRGNFGNRAQGGPQRVCTNCGKNNHTVDNCYHIHGFPPGYKSRNRANAVCTDDTDETEINARTYPIQGSNVTLTQEEYQGILSLLQQSKVNATTPIHAINSAHSSIGPITSNFNQVSGKPCDQWRLDTGATDHITYKIEHFKS